MSPAPSAHRIAVACALSCALLASVMSGPAAADQPVREPPAQAEGLGGGGGGGEADIQAPVALAGAKAQQKQDLRSADARDAAAPRRPVNAPGATAVDSATRPALPGPPTSPVNPRPIAPAPVVHASDTGSGIDWTTIGLGIAGSLLVLGGIAAVALHSRRVSRTRVAA